MLVETECLTMGHQVTMWPELPIVNWVLSDPPRHKAGRAQLHSVIKRKWYIWDQVQAGPEGTSKLEEEVAQIPMSPLLLHYLLSQLHRGPHGEFPMPDWLRKRKLRPGLWEVLHDIQALLESCNALTPLWDSPVRTVVKGNSPSGHNFQSVHLIVHFAYKEKWPEV